MHIIQFKEGALLNQRGPVHYPLVRPTASKMWNKVFLPSGLSSKEMGHFLSVSPQPWGSFTARLLW